MIPSPRAILFVRILVDLLMLHFIPRLQGFLQSLLENILEYGIVAGRFELKKYICRV